jgi:hypothetical protein
MTSSFDEEPWEQEIGSMLGALPSVEPPAGFIDSAIDHRPLYAGRTVLALLALSLVAVSAAALVNPAGRTTVAPDFDDLAQRHTAVRAGVVPEGSEVDYRVETPVEMPEGFERTGNLEIDELQQAVYANGDRSVSVFVQDGKPRWEALGAEGRRTIDGRQVWIDPEREVAVVEVVDKTVTIVGLAETDLDQVLSAVPVAGPGLLDRIGNTVDAVTEQLGYPSVGG